MQEFKKIKVEVKMNKIREKVLFNSVIANGYYKRFQNVMVEYDTIKYNVKNNFKVARIISELEPNDCIMIKRSNISEDKEKMRTEFELIRHYAKVFKVNCVLDKEFRKDYERINDIMKYEGVKPYMTIEMNEVNEFMKKRRNIRLETNKDIRETIKRMEEKYTNVIYKTYNRVNLEYLNKLERRQMIEVDHLVPSMVRMDNRHYIYNHMLARMNKKFIVEVPIIIKQNIKQNIKSLIKF